MWRAQMDSLVLLPDADVAMIDSGYCSIYGDYMKNAYVEHCRATW